MAKHVYRGSQSLLDVRSEDPRGVNPQEQEIIVLLDVIDEVPPIPVDPPQGFQAELGLIYLYNPDAANRLINKLNLTIEEVNDAVADVTQLTVDALKIKPYSLLGESIAIYTPCEFDGCIYIATQTIDQKPAIFDPSQWAKAATADYNKLFNKPSFITRADLSCTVPGLTYNYETGVLSLTTGYVVPTVAKMASIDSNIATNAANIAQETQQRISAIDTTNSRIDSLSTWLNAEKIERTAADSQMAGNISGISGRLTAHESNYNNPHQVTKAQVGLGNVNNTADLDKPISTLTRQALDELSARIASTDADLSNYRTSAAQDLIDAQIRVEISNVAQSVTVEEAARMSSDAVLGGRITGIEEVIPSTASTDNLLADRAFVNSSINNMAAYYITASASGNAFGDRARLVSGPWYFQGQLRTPTMNDYALVIADETHYNRSARYLFDGVQWAFQYTLNNTEFTQAQIDAINSTITEDKVISYDAHIVDTNNPHEVTAEQVGLGNVNNTSDMNKPVSTLQQAALNLKQNIITDLDSIRAGALLGSTAVQPSALDDYETISHAEATYQLKGDYVTTAALNLALSTKQNNLIAGTGITIANDVISVTFPDTIAWGNITGTISNQADLKNALDGKQDVLVSGTSIKTINGQSVLGAGDITVGGAVESVNGKTGTVVLTGEDISADVSESIDTVQGHLQTLHDKVQDIELFKFPNATIIGEPIIDHGQVSGFSESSYLQFPFIVDLHNQPFVIDFCFTTGNDVATQQNILDSQFGLALAIANGRGLMAISHNGTSWAGVVTGTMAIQPNTTYYARLSWNRINYKTELSTDGTTYVADMNFGSTQSPYPCTMFIGGCSGSAIGHTPHPFGGTINLNYAYLTISGSIVWQGMDDAGLATRADISLDNLDAVGQNKVDSTKNQNADSGINRLYDWAGTLQEAIDQNVRALHPDWKIYITDDVSGGDSVYTKAQVDALLAAQAENNPGFCSYNTNTRIPISTTTQTATKNGWLMGSLWFSGNNVYFALEVDGIEVNHSPWAGAAWGVLNASIPLKAGQTYRYYGNGTVEQNHLYFYPNE